MRKTLLTAGLAGLLAAGCGGSPGPSGPDRVVFKVPSGFQNGGPAWVQRTLDLGLPLLHNVTGSPVRLRSVELVTPRRGVRLLNATAYVLTQVSGTTISAFGDLPKECPGTYVPHPLTAAVTAPHSDSNWTVIIALRIPRPGTYHFTQVKINYTVVGQQGWQYYNLNDVVHELAGYGPRLKGCPGASE